MIEPAINRNTIIQAFTELAPDYELSMHQELKQYWGLNYLDFIHELVTFADIQPGERVLDIATGTARIPRRLVENAARPAQVIGLDITFAMLAEGKARIREDAGNQNIRLVCGSALDLPFSNGSLDVILCGLGTHHIPVPRLISEMRRVLTPGGKLVLADVCASRFWRSRPGLLLIHFMAQRYRAANQNARTEAELEAFPNVRTVDEWLEILQVNNFTRIDIKEIKSRLPWYPGGFHARALAN